MDQGVPPRTPTLVTLGQRLKPPYPVQKHTGEACTSRRRLRAGLCGITETESILRPSAQDSVCNNRAARSEEALGGPPALPGWGTARSYPGTRTATVPASMIVRAQGPQVNPRGSLLQPTRVQEWVGQLQDPSGGTQHFASFT